MKRLACLLLLALAMATGFAKDAAPLAEDPAVEARLIAISEEMRCLVCQNESLAGSRSDLANDLRRELRTLIKAGKTDQEIREFMVARYGDFVLYRPPVKATTIMLWAGPFVLLAFGALTFVVVVRKRRPHAPEPFDDAARRRAQALLAEEPETRS